MQTRMTKQICTFVALLAIFTMITATGLIPYQSVSILSQNNANTPKGIVLDYENAVVYIVDVATNAVTGPFLSGVATSFLDVVLTPDQKTAILSDFHGHKIFFADISDATNPTIIDSIDFSSIPSATYPFHPEDLAITPSGNYVVASDGGGCGYPTLYLGVASIQISNRSLVQYLTLDSPKQVQNVSIDNYDNVFAGDICNKKLYLLTIGVNGTLTDTDVAFDLPYGPKNSYISPDSSRLFVVGTGGVTIFQINGPGNITKIKENTTVGHIQSMAFSTDGTKVFLGDISTSPDRIIVAKTDDLTIIRNVDLLTDLTNLWFGVDVMSFEPSGQRLYMGNMYDSSYGTTTNKVMVIKLNDYSLDTIDLASDSLPTSIAFRGVYSFEFFLPMILQ